MSKAEVTKPKQAKNKKYMLVRYSRMNTLGLFEHRETRIPKVSTRVVIKTGKGLELGCLVGQLSSYRAGQLKFDSDQIKKYFDDSNIDIAIEQAGKFVRYATPADISEERHLKKIAEEEMECCRRFIKELNLPMKIVDAEHIFGGERVIFYFMSDGRVDFRELVKKIAHEYQTRIEMRQIGSRDEAKILGDVESCGQQCCCQRFLKLLKPVNMRMAKMQKATLDPSKISGYCGRLKCCLRYEDKTYTELKKRLPKKNTRVKTKQGEGKVAGTQILTQLVMIESADGMRVAVPLEELEVISTTYFKKKKRNGAQNNHQQKNMENNTDSQAQYDEETLEQ
jgi:cell fate regulator YaaT (PSP1 superfamily)